jgi:hypothetical protein
MSIKTLKKRIALVAVSALTAGFLSVATAPVANADIGAADLTENTLYLGTTKSVTGSAAAGSAATGVTGTMTQVGYITDTSASAQTTGPNDAIYVNASEIRTANVYPGAAISFTATGKSGTTDTDGLTVTVTGGTLSSLAATAEAVVTLATTNVSSDVKTVTTDAAGQDVIYGIFNVTAAVGSVATISVFSGPNIAGLTTATSGTLVGQYQLTVASASVSGIYSAADSTVTQQPCLANSTGSGNADSLAYDTTSRCANGYVGVIYVDLEDGYGAELTGGTVTAATSAGKVIISAATTTGSTVNGATSGFDDQASDGEVWVLVSQPTANTAGSATVTITFNGTVVGTKTINWGGEVASLTVDTVNSNTIYSTSQADTPQNIGAAGVIYTAKDAAGNVLTLAAQPSVYEATGALVGSTLSTTTVVTLAAVQTSSRGYGYSFLIVPGNSLSGKATYQLSLTNSSGVTIKSNVVNATVSRGATNSFSISWNKASYSTGDIAEATISIKDAYGNPMADGTALTGLDFTVSSAGFSAALGSGCAAARTSVGGSVVCKYAALNDEGTYSYTIDMTTATAQSAVVGALPIKSATTAVSNADVLKSIVALIASINKQIQALQKLILKR